MNLIHQGFLNIGATGAVCKHNKQTWPLFLAQQDWENKVEWAREWMKIGREGAFPRAKQWIRNKTLFCDCFTVVLLLSTNKNVHASTETCRKKYLICVNLARVILSAVSLSALCMCMCVCVCVRVRVHALGIPKIWICCSWHAKQKRETRQECTLLQNISFCCYWLKVAQNRTKVDSQQSPKHCKLKGNPPLFMWMSNQCWW